MTTTPMNQPRSIVDLGNRSLKLTFESTEERDFFRGELEARRPPANVIGPWTVEATNNGVDFTDIGEFEDLAGAELFAAQRRPFWLRVNVLGCDADKYRRYLLEKAEKAEARGCIAEAARLYEEADGF